MHMLTYFLWHLAMPFLLGFYGMKAWYWIKDRRSK